MSKEIVEPWIDAVPLDSIIHEGLSPTYGLDIVSAALVN
jgi:hypothetical protein